MTASVASTVMLTWFPAVLAPTLAVLLGGPAFPGFGTLPDRGEVPAAVLEAVEDADIAPETGGIVRFNDPTGSRGKQFALVRRLNGAIDDARAGGTVRLAAYSLAMPSTTRALVRAHRRGVDVRVVVDDHSRHWGSVRTLRAELGTSTGRDSFLKICRMSCRGGRGNQHMKFLTVSDSRRGQGVVLVGSLNLTRFSSTRQWNDLYSVADEGIHAQMVTTFEQLAADRPRGRLVLPRTATGFDTDVSPYPRVTLGQDPLVRRLRSVRCKGTAVTAGDRGRTVVRIVMHAWNGDRGIALARRVVRLDRQGCDVRVLYGKGTGRVVKRLFEERGVPARDSGMRSGRRVHHKVMLVSGVVGGRPDANYVWTGSHNWSDRSLRNDEIMLRVGGRDLVDAYLANFRRIWRTTLSR
jgi:phosphatidylserine/phosphatidylglycerophosphate/cardiolipin synthase-like enzyme